MDYRSSRAPGYAAPVLGLALHGRWLTRATSPEPCTGRRPRRRPARPARRDALPAGGGGAPAPQRVEPDGGEYDEHGLH